jgi:hypothetical protein
MDTTITASPGLIFYSFLLIGGCLVVVWAYFYRKRQDRE